MVTIITAGMAHLVLDSHAGPVPPRYVHHAKGPKDLVDETHVLLEQHLPHGSHRHNRGDIREEQRGTEETDALEFLVNQHRQAKRQERGNGDSEDSIDNRFANTGQEITGLEYLLEIFQAHEFNGIKAIPFTHT